MGLYTEIGRRRPPRPLARRDHQRDPRVGHRPPHRPAGRPAHRRRGQARPGSSAASPGSWETLLRNRPLDVWMHEQDVRRAVGRPGGLDAPAAEHVADYLAESLGVRAGQAGRRGPPAPRRCSTVDGQRAARRTASTTTAAAERLPEVPRRPDRAADDGPRDVRPARRRPPRPRAGRGPRRRRPARSASGCSAGSSSPGDPATASPRSRRLAARGHPRPVRPHRRGHRHHRRRPRPPHRARAGPARRPRRPGRAQPRPASPRRRRRSAARSRDAALETAGARPRRPRRRYAAPRPDAARLGPLDLLVNNAGVMAHAVPADRRRPRAADGHQPLRPVPAHRAAAAAAGRRRGRTRRHGLLADAPGRPRRPARRPPPRGRPLPPVAGVRRAPSWPTCCSPTSWTGGPAGRGSP